MRESGIISHVSGSLPGRLFLSPAINLTGSRCSIFYLNLGAAQKNPLLVSHDYSPPKCLTGQTARGCGVNPCRYAGTSRNHLHLA